MRTEAAAQNSPPVSGNPMFAANNVAPESGNPTPAPIAKDPKPAGQMRSTRFRPRRWLAAVTGSARTRILVMMMSMMTFALVLTGVALYSFQVNALEERVRESLDQEVTELGELSRYGTNGQPYTNPEDLLTDFLSHAVPSRDEGMFGAVDGTPIYVARDASELHFDIASPQLLAIAEEARQPGATVPLEVRFQNRELRLQVADVQFTDLPSRALFVVVVDIGEQRNWINRAMMMYALLAALALVLAMVVGFILTSRLMRPLVELRKATNEIGTADLARRVTVREPDNDVAQLAVNFNQMLHRLESGFADQRQFLDDAAHELRTPLTILRGNLETLDPHDADDVSQTRALAVGEVDRMDRLVSDLLVLAKSRRPDFLRVEPVDVAALVDEAYARIQMLGDRDWRINASAAGLITADPARLLQAIAQLSANAVRFSSTGAVIELGARWVDRNLGNGSQRFLVLTVADTGIGIAAEDMPGLFERFQQVPGDSNDGLGLGLAIVRAITTGHGGTVTVESELGVGSTFEMWIPRR